MGTPHDTDSCGGAGTVGRVDAPRRSPNFTRFIAAGAVVGFVVGSGLAVLGDPAPGYGEGAAVAYIGLFGAAIGAMLAAVVAVLLDRRG
jgi:hypothetical protein